LPERRLDQLVLGLEVVVHVPDRDVGRLRDVGERRPPDPLLVQHPAGSGHEPLALAGGRPLNRCDGHLPAGRRHIGEGQVRGSGISYLTNSSVAALLEVNPWRKPRSWRLAAAGSRSPCCAASRSSTSSTRRSSTSLFPPSVTTCTCRCRTCSGFRAATC